MGSIFKKIGIELTDSLSSSAFGRLRTAEEGNRVDVEFTYDKQKNLTDEVTVGTGTVSFNSNSRDLSLSIGGVGITSSAGIYTYPAPYTPGNSQEVDITGVLDMAGIGGGVAEFFLRSSVSGVPVDLKIIPSTEWGNQDIVKNIDWKKSHILAMDFQSLKVGRIRYGLNIGGVTIPLASIVNDNKYNTGFWQYPQQPAFWNIYNSGSETIMEMGYGDDDNAIGLRYRIPINAGAIMKAICATVKSEGGLDIKDIEGLNRGGTMGATTKTVSTSLVPLISIRPKSTFQSYKNRGIALPKNYSIHTDNPISLILLHDVTLTGSPSWFDVDTTYSMMEYDISASGYSNGCIVFADYVGTSKNRGISSKNLLGKTILWNRRGTETGILTLAAMKTGTSDAKVAVGFNWGEIR